MESGFSHGEDCHANNPLLGATTCPLRVKAHVAGAAAKQVGLRCKTRLCKASDRCCAAAWQVDFRCYPGRDWFVPEHHLARLNGGSFCDFLP